MNMSHCRFENTSRDLADCVGHLADDNLSSSHENFGRICLVLSACDLLEELGIEVDKAEAERLVKALPWEGEDEDEDEDATCETCESDSPLNDDGLCAGCQSDKDKADEKEGE